MTRHVSGYTELEMQYRTAGPDSFGLYLGGGVNLPVPGIRAHHAMTSWTGLIERLYELNKASMTHPFEMLAIHYGEDWAGLLDAVQNGMGDSARASQIEALLYHEIERDGPCIDTHVLDGAPTLQAALGFSAQVCGGGGEAPWGFQRNRRIGMVITPNIDEFYAAGWGCYGGLRDQWAIQTPFEKAELAPPRRPIYYLHSYIPFKREQAPSNHRLAISRQARSLIYAPGGYVRGVLAMALRHLRLIFLGTSFNDPALAAALRESPRGRHFAIVRAHHVERVRELGVLPVVVSDHSQVPLLLATIYCAGLDPAEIGRYGFRNAAEYWERLFRGVE